MSAAGGVNNNNTSSTTSRPVDADGNMSSEWWCQGLSKHGAAVTYVAGGSSAVAVGGQCTKGGNIALWDTLSHPENGAIGRLSHHKAAVTCLYTLPGGWLLAAGDADGALSLTDLRMLGTTGINNSNNNSNNNNNNNSSTGSGGGGRVLWSVKASRGAVKSVVTTTAATTSRSGMSALLVTGGQDGAVRVWRSGDGHLVQSIEAAHYSGSNLRPKHGKLAMNGDLSSPTSSNSGVPVAVSGLSVCSEGVVTCGADGMVRLFPVG
jgi:WD40 repeat protein